VNKEARAVLPPQSPPGGKELKTRLIIGVAGVACQAFDTFASFCQEYGNLTLGELSKMAARHGYCMIWRGQ